MFEKILDKIDGWNSRVYDWQRTSSSRAALVFCLNFLWAIPLAFAFIGVVTGLLVFFGWVIGALIGI